MIYSLSSQIIFVSYMPYIHSFDACMLGPDPKSRLWSCARNTTTSRLRPRSQLRSASTSSSISRIAPAWTNSHGGWRHTALAVFTVRVVIGCAVITSLTCIYLGVLRRHGDVLTEMQTRNSQLILKQLRTYISVAIYRDHIRLQSTAGEITKWVAQKMFYNGFKEKITRKYGIIIIGWPLPYFLRPSRIRSIADLEALYKAWSTGAAYFYKLSAAEYKAWVEQNPTPRTQAGDAEGEDDEEDADENTPPTAVPLTATTRAINAVSGASGSALAVTETASRKRRSDYQGTHNTKRARLTGDLESTTTGSSEAVVAVPEASSNAGHHIDSGVYPSTRWLQEQAGPSMAPSSSLSNTSAPHDRSHSSGTPAPRPPSQAGAPAAQPWGSDAYWSNEGSTSNSAQFNFNFGPMHGFPADVGMGSDASMSSFDNDMLYPHFSMPPVYPPGGQWVTEDPLLQF